MSNKKTLKALGAVYAGMNPAFKQAIPEPTLKYYGDFANPLLEDDRMMNEFLDQLVNKIGLTIVKSKIKDNPLRLLKKGDKPMGSDVEEIFVEMAKLTEFDASGQDLLKVYEPEVLALLHRVNFKGTYKVSWRDTEIKHAFSSIEGMTELIDKLITSLYAGAYHTEFERTKLLIAEGVEKELLITQETVIPTDLNTAKDFAKQIKKHSLGMTFTSSKYNRAMKKDGATKKVTPVKTFTERDQQVLLINADALVEVDVELLASAFNMSKTDFSEVEYVIPVDDFTSVTVDDEGVEKTFGEDIIAVLADRATFQIYDDNFKLAPLFYNASNETHKAYLHVSQVYSLSTFSNAIVFTKKVEEAGE